MYPGHSRKSVPRGSCFLHAEDRGRWKARWVTEGFSDGAKVAHRRRHYWRIPIMDGLRGAKKWRYRVVAWQPSMVRFYSNFPLTAFILHLPLLTGVNKIIAIQINLLFGVYFFKIIDYYGWYFADNYFNHINYYEYYYCIIIIDLIFNLIWIHLSLLRYHIQLFIFSLIVYGYICSE